MFFSSSKYQFELLNYANLPKQIGSIYWYLNPIFFLGQNKFDMRGVISFGPKKVFLTKNPPYGRQSISRPMQIVSC